jgi:predicted ATPase
VVAYELHYAGGRHDQMVQQVTDLRVRYGYVFQLDLLPLAKNDVRIEDSETALSLDALYERIYREAGYDVVRVPVLPVAERMAFVLERCQVVLQRARANELTIEASCLRA